MKDREKLVQRDVGKLPEGLHRVESGLYIRVRGKYINYIARLQTKGRRRDYAIGPHPDVSLDFAKQVLRRLKGQIAEGVDPWLIKAAEKAEREAPQPTTFGQYAIKCIETLAAARRWRSSVHARQWRSSIEMYAIPVIGDMELSEVTHRDILRVLQPIWETKCETASRVRGRLETIFDQAIFEGEHPGPNPALWRGNLSRFLPPESKVHKVTHHEAMTLEEARLASAVLWASKRPLHSALLFGILTASRAQEFLGARWSEIDIGARVWSCPRRKDGKAYPHRVPLSDQAMMILLRAPKTGSDLVFPNPSGEEFAVDSPRHAIRTVVGRPVTTHGCRSTFRDWCESTGVDWVLAEKSLMHSTGSEVERAYQRSDLLDQRRPVMQAWADALLAPKIEHETTKITSF